jgi:hypothetical protein
MYRFRTVSRHALKLVLGAAMALSIAGRSHADTITFDFNSLSDGASNTKVSNYMNNTLNDSGLGTVVVKGAVAERNYTGDNHVVGNTYNGRAKSNTLGTSDGATGPLSNQRAPLSNGAHHDTFLVNDNFGFFNNSDRITMTFTLPVGYSIQSVSFDYQIFPNWLCPGGSGSSNCWSVPDFKFEADDVEIFKTLASKPSGSPVDANNSPDSSNEKAWQFLGVSGLIGINDSDNVTKLEFIDWPALIGIDNLSINYSLPLPPTPVRDVPEPGSLLLIGIGAGGLAMKRFTSLRKAKTV